MPWKEIGSASDLENTVEEAGHITQLVECSPGMHKVLSLTPALHKSDCGGVYLHPKRSGGGNRKIRISGHLQLCFEHEARLGYRRLCL